MNIMILGSGAREHALAWKSAQSPLINKVYVVPGNGGTAQEPKIENINLNLKDFQALVTFAKSHDIILTIVGPEQPLCEGVVNYFNEHQLNCFGPTQEAAIIEGSKTFSKEFLERHNIPTAKYGSFVDYQAAKEFLATHNYPLVIKADGLASGKGVFIVNSFAEAVNVLDHIMIDKALGLAGQQIIIEEFLNGIEMSFIVMTDGIHYKPLATSQDYKRLTADSNSPNTGGMGAISPSPHINQNLEQKICEEIITPTIDGLRKEGRLFKGFLYAGLMIVEGQPKVLEYNCRLGDPETQALLVRMESDLIPLVLSIFQGNFQNEKIDWSPDPAACIVLAAPGYPSKPEIGLRINGLSSTSNNQNVKIFHAGTIQENNAILSTGGRVLCISNCAKNLDEVRKNCYDTISNINFSGMQFRSDIGLI